LKALGLAGLLLLWGPGSAAAGGARVLLTGVYAPETLRFAATRAFTEYAEAGSLEASQRSKPGFGGELGLEYDFTAHIGVRGSLAYVRRLGDARYEARLPHPLYLDQHRLVSGSAGGLDRREATLSLELVAILGSGPVQVSLLGGGAFFQVDVSVVGDLQKREAYPYDSVDVTGLSSRRLQDRPIGYTAAVGLDWRIGGHFGLGLQGRYSRARVRLQEPEGDSLAFNAGGLQAGFGLRLLF
jgi:hypothetical protein